MGANVVTVLSRPVRDDVLQGMPGAAPPPGGGITVLALMGLATLVIVLVVWAVAALGPWWALIPAVAIHLDDRFRFRDCRAYRS
jgi:hypothetical protein